MLSRLSALKQSTKNQLNTKSTRRKYSNQSKDIRETKISVEQNTLSQNVNLITFLTEEQVSQKDVFDFFDFFYFFYFFDFFLFFLFFLIFYFFIFFDFFTYI